MLFVVAALAALFSKGRETKAGTQCLFIHTSHRVNDCDPGLESRAIERLIVSQFEPTRCVQSFGIISHN
jgi:hypothetical protein